MFHPPAEPIAKVSGLGIKNPLSWPWWRDKHGKIPIGPPSLPGCGNDHDSMDNGGIVIVIINLYYHYVDNCYDNCYDDDDDVSLSWLWRLWSLRWLWWGWWQSSWQRQRSQSLPGIPKIDGLSVFITDVSTYSNDHFGVYYFSPQTHLDLKNPNPPAANHGKIRLWRCHIWSKRCDGIRDPGHREAKCRPTIDYIMLT